MLFGKTKLELKVGVFVFVALVILSVFILSIGRFKTWNSGYRLNFVFHFINGVKKGAPIRFAGVDIGEVKQIKFIIPNNADKTKIKLVGWIRSDIKVPTDSVITVNTLGLLGEKYIEIMPGKNFQSAMANQDLEGTDPIAMNEVFELAKKVVTDIDDSIVRIKNKEGSLGKLIYGDTIYNEVEAFVTDIRKNPWKLFYKTKEQ